MAVTDTKIIDFASIDAEDEVILTIFDHLEWDDEHLFILQEKINCYLAFIESGEIFETYPKSIGRKVAIELVAKYEIFDTGLMFINKVKEVLDTIGVGFRYIKQ
jgi:hypothetical protein